MQDDSEIIAILDSGIEALLQGNRQLYNQQINRIIDDIGRTKTYRYMHSCLLREAQKAEALLNETISRGPLWQERQQRAKLLRDEARIFAHTSRQPRKATRPQEAAEH